MKTQKTRRLNHLKKIGNLYRELLLKIKISVVLLFIGLSSNAQDESYNISGYYISKQDVNLNKSILYHFSSDSLLIYNAGNRGYVRFSVEYQSNKIFVNNSQIKDYELNIKVQNDSIIELVDRDNIFSSNIKNKLVKFEIDSEIDINKLTNKYWKTTTKNDQIILYFHSQLKNVDEYVNNDNSGINCYPLFREYSKFKQIYFIDFLLSGNLIVTTRLENNCLTFKNISPNGKDVNFNFFLYKQNNNNISLNDKWKKIKSNNSLDLPDELIITDRMINISDTIVNYRLGLNDKFIIYRNNNNSSRCVKIEKLTEDELNLKIKSNRAHSEETGVYEKK